MTQTIQAVVEGDVLRPLGNVQLRDQQIVQLIVISQESSDSKRSFLDVAKEVGAVGVTNDLPADLSTNPSHLEGFGRS